MIVDPNDPPAEQIRKLTRIVDALIARNESAHELGYDGAFGLFQSALALEGEVSARRRDLERAQWTLERASDELEVHRDARRRMQRALADAMEAMSGGFALFVEGRLQACNDQFRALLPDLREAIAPGLEMEAYFSMLRDSRFVVRDADSAPPGAEGALPGDESFVLPMIGDRWVQVTRRPAASGAVAVLQTEISGLVRRNRRETDRLIDSQAQLLQAALENIRSGVCTFSAEATVLIANQRFAALLGLPRELTADGAQLNDILCYVDARNPEADSLAAHLPDWRAALAEGRDVRRRMRREDGLVLEIRAGALPDGGFLVAVIDVTAETLTTEALERRVAERTAELTEVNLRLRRQNAELERIQQALRAAKEETEAAASSKTRFLAAASHDLLQPISAAKLSLSTLRDMALSEQAAESAARLDRSFNLIETLLQALLDISRLESAGVRLSLADFSLREIFETIRDEYAPMAARKGLELRVAPCAHWVRSDHRYLLRSVQNLVVNAIQNTNCGKVLLGCRHAGDALRIEVWDTGVGIAPQDQSRIFEAFTRIGAGGEYGIGLGLSIVDQACRHLGHALRLRSTLGRGSVFSIEVPRARAGCAPMVDLEPDEAKSVGDMDVIALVVENDSELRAAMTRRLDAWGASVLSAGSTEEAVEQALSIGVAPDIILADYQLDNGDDGVAAIRAVRQATGAHAPAIMVTADRSGVLGPLSVEHDFTVMTKPILSSRLRPLIDWKTRGRSGRGADATE